MLTCWMAAYCLASEIAALRCAASPNLAITKSPVRTLSFMRSILPSILAMDCRDKTAQSESEISFRARATRKMKYRSYTTSDSLARR